MELHFKKFKACYIIDLSVRFIEKGLGDENVLFPLGKRNTSMSKFNIIHMDQLS